MKKIYKYTLQITDEQTIALPYGAEILSIQNQNGELVFWAQVQVSPSPLLTDWHFLIVGTGHELPLKSNNQVYLDTVQMGSLVWHIYAY